ncbi:phospholipase A [Paraburkholderia rhizosphaerae]|uniref:phospholipase A n=1 Tax=Paraburkholderia rhizosphaerae TaxID=480658 RepID=UPI001FBBA271|nr:phospholipase A [Paraburkholderia rhizosphaerae]
MTIVYSGDAPSGTSFDVPRTLNITLTNGEALPLIVPLTRVPGAPEHLRLAAGEMKAVSYSAAWPDSARGALRIDVPGVDVSPSVVLLTRKPDHAAPATASTTAAAPASTNESATTPATANAAPAAAASAPNATAAPGQAVPGNAALAAAMPPSAVQPSNSLIPDLGRFLAGRISPYEPTFFADGWDSHGHNLAKFQISFMFRFILPEDPRSRSFFDNLYFGYTQSSLWDLGEYSAPFRDTSYMPALFYYLPDTGWKASWFTRLGMMAGYEHESNGRDGEESRGVDILFVKPIFEFGDLTANHFKVEPKVYWYQHIAGENGNITDYRGYVDLKVTYGSPDGWQLAATMRKGTKSTYGSIDTQFTYPLAKLFGSAAAGYLFVQYFNGYGEDILDYNQHRWVARIGFSVSR